MPKGIWTFALLMVLPAYGLGQKKDRPTVTQNDSGDNRSPSFSFVQNQAACPDASGTHDEPPPWWKAPEWWLFIIAIPTLGVVGWQAKLMAKHAEHLKELAASAAENAKASALNAQALIDSERAWISIRTNMGGFDPAQNPKDFSWQIRNSGRSVAKLISTNARCFIWNGIGSLPQTLQYERDDIILNGRILVPKDSYPFKSRIEGWEDGKFGRLEQRFRMTEQVGLHIMVYGTVKYETLGTIHESNFIEYYESYGSSHPKRDFVNRLDAPAAYSKHT